jgi:hypothetical protein
MNYNQVSVGEGCLQRIVQNLNVGVPVVQVLEITPMSNKLGNSSQENERYKYVYNVY